MPECQMSKKLNGGLDQYGTECFGRLIFATIRKSVGLKGLKNICIMHTDTKHIAAIFQVDLG